MEMSKKTSPYFHSNFARIVVNELIVGRIIAKSQTVTAKINETVTLNKNIKTFGFMSENY